MALIQCKDCRKSFSSDAQRCPHCGANKPGMRSGDIFVIIVVLFFVGFVSLLFLSHTATPPSPTVSDNAFKVCEAVKNTGMASECDVNVSISGGSNIDVRVDTNAHEAKNMCLGMVSLLAKKTTGFNGAWHLRIFSPFSGEHPLATCILQ
jgi:hypothetical protein